MASLIRNKRRPKLITPSNSSFSNCVQDQLFTHPPRGPLDTFKPVIYLDEQGRRHGRVSDHLLQRQIETDRQKLKKQPIPKVPVSSSLYGIRNPNIASLIRDVPIDNDDDDDEDKLQADDEIKFIEYKKLPKPASKSGARRVSTVSGKQSVKFDTTPSVNMARLVESHLTEMDDIDNVDDDDSENDDDDDDDDDEDDLESIKPAGNARSKYRNQRNKSGDELSETPSTTKDNDNADNYEEDENDGITTNSTLEYKRSSQEMHMPPTVEDIHDEEEEEEEEQKQREQGESENDLSSPDAAQRRRQRKQNESEDGLSSPDVVRQRRQRGQDESENDLSSPDVVQRRRQHEQDESENDLSSPDVVQRRKQSEKSSEKTIERQKSASSRPKTASTRSHTDNEEPKTSRASSSSTTSSDDTSALLRSDNDNSPNISDHESNNEDEHTPIQSPVKSIHRNSNISNVLNLAHEDEEGEDNLPPLQSTAKLSQRDVKGEYDPSQVIQLKESFQPVINEAASYGHLDIVRKLIERGQSVHTQNLLQRTPLHEACVSGNEELVSELLINGALIDQRDSQGMAPLHVAASHGTLKCVRILCEKGCDINAQDNLGQTAAHYSAMHNHVDTLKYLTNIRHIDLSLCNNESKLPIHYAVKHGSKNVLNLLLQSNLTIYGTDQHGNTIAHEASEHNQLECMKLIWKKDQNLLTKKNHLERTPSHTAALHGSIDVLHWLLELHLIDINEPDKKGYTMAHLAVSRGHGECFSCLIMHGAQLDVYTFDRHESVLDTAKRSGKNNRIEQARSGKIRCQLCEKKVAKEKHDQAHSHNAVEQLIHTQIQRGYNLNLPANRAITNLSLRNRPMT